MGTASQMVQASQAGNFTPTLRSSLASGRFSSSVSASRPSKRVRIEEAAFDEEEEEEQQEEQEKKITPAQPRDVSMSSRLSPVADEQEEGGFEVENGNHVDPDSLPSTGTLQSSGSDSGSLSKLLSSSQQQPSPSSSLPLIHNPLSGPPSTSFLLKALEDETKKQPRVDVEYQDPFFSDPKDIPTKAREFGGQKWILGGKKEKRKEEEDGEEEKVVEEFRFESRSCEGLEEIGVGSVRMMRDRRTSRMTSDGEGVGRRVLGWEVGGRAPTRGEVERWVEQEVEPEENSEFSCSSFEQEGRENLH